MADSEAFHAESPGKSNFSAGLIGYLRPGGHVKLWAYVDGITMRVPGAKVVVGGLGFWAKVVEPGGPDGRMLGTVANGLGGRRGLHLGDELRFERRHVIDVEFIGPSGEPEGAESRILSWRKGANP